MPQAKYDDRTIQQIEHLLSMLRDERVGQMNTTRPTIRPLHSWDEQTNHLRFAEKVKLHRYPGGLANTTRWRRDRKVALHRERIAGMGAQGIAAREAIHEAMAYAVDVERFLGSFDRRDERGRFPVDDVDDVATHLLVWLEERGYQLVPKSDDSSSGQA